MKNLIIKIQIIAILIITIMIFSNSQVLAANDAEVIKNTWDVDIYGRGKAQTVSQTFNSKDFSGNGDPEKQLSQINGADKVYSGIKLDIVRNRLLLAWKKDTSPTVKKTIKVKGITTISQSNIKEMYTKQQKQALENIEKWQKTANEYVKKLTEEANSNPNPGKQVTAMQNIKDIQQRIDDSNTIKKWLKNAIKKNSNSDKEIGIIKVAGTNVNPTQRDSETDTSQEDFQNTSEKVSEKKLEQRDLGYVESNNDVKEQTIDTTMTEADQFIDLSQNNKIDQSKLAKIVKSLYNALLAVAIVAAVIIGTYMAVKLITSSVEGQAKIKEMFIPYIIGCVVAFGAFGIWALAMKIFNAM